MTHREPEVMHAVFWHRLMSEFSFTVIFIKIIPFITINFPLVENLKSCLMLIKPLGQWLSRVSSSGEEISSGAVKNNVFNLVNRPITDALSFQNCNFPFTWHCKGIYKKRKLMCTYIRECVLWTLPAVLYKDLSALSRSPMYGNLIFFRLLV